MVCRSAPFKEVFLLALFRTRPVFTSAQAIATSTATACRHRRPRTDRHACWLREVRHPLRTVTCPAFRAGARTSRFVPGGVPLREHENRSEPATAVESSCPRNWTVGALISVPPC